MSYKEYLLGELSSDALSDDRTSIEWDNGDRLRWLGNALIGRGAEFSREGVRSRAKELKEKNVNQALATDRRTIADLLAGTGIDTSNLTLGGQRTESDLKAEMASLLTTGKAAQAYATRDGASLSDIKPGSTLATITELDQGLKKKNRETAEKKVTDEKNRIYKRDRDRADELYKRDLLREDRRDARQELQLAQQRKDELELRRDNMNLEYARLSQADANRAQDRKDKAIMALLSGLGNMAAGFTI